MKSTLLGVSAIVAAVTMSACSSDDGTNTEADTPAATVQVSSNQFTPAQVKVKVGDIVRWTWTGGTHNVVSGTNCSPDGNFTSKEPTSSGIFDQKFETAGTFPYYCQPHCAMGMKGEVVVEP